jgi:excisionase family DNA binding protein
MDMEASKDTQLTFDHIESLLTEEQACKKINCSSQMLRRKRRTGELEYYQLGRKILYSPTNLSRFLETCKRSQQK